MFFETYKDTKKKFRWRLKARNGKILASGEGFETEIARDNSIALVRQCGNAPVKPGKTPTQKPAKPKIV